MEPNRARLEAGRVSLRLDRPADALGFARQALAREPRNAEALLVAGLASLALETPAEATAFLQQAATIDPPVVDGDRTLTTRLGLPSIPRSLMMASRSVSTKTMSGWTMVVSARMQSIGAKNSLPRHEGRQVGAVP